MRFAHKKKLGEKELGASIAPKTVCPAPWLGQKQFFLKVGTPRLSEITRVLDQISGPPPNRAALAPGERGQNRGAAKDRRGELRLERSLWVLHEASYGQAVRRRAN